MIIIKKQKTKQYYNVRRIEIKLVFLLIFMPLIRLIMKKSLFI